jgi:hypothetical protein
MFAGTARWVLHVPARLGESAARSASVVAVVLASWLGASTAMAAPTGHSLPPGAREVPQLRTERSQTWVLPSGAYLTRAFQRPVNYLDRSGGWQPIQNQLVADRAGGWHNKANRSSGRASTTSASGTTIQEVRVGRRPTLCISLRIFSKRIATHMRVAIPSTLRIQQELASSSVARRGTRQRGSGWV